MQGTRSLGDLHVTAEDETSQRLFVRGCFEVRCETRFGDTVAIVGSSEQLGRWRPECGLLMTTDEASYPIWHCEPLLRAAADELEFKFIILRGDGGPPNWEPLAENRRLAIPQGVDDMQVFADWGIPSACSMGPSSEQPPTPWSSRSESQATSPPSSRPPVSPMIGRAPAPLAVPAMPSRDPSAPAARHSISPPPARSDEPATPPLGLQERLLVVMHHLPVSARRDATDGSWVVEWDESSLLATSVQGGRHLLGGLNLEVIFIGLPKTPIPRESEHDVAEQMASSNEPKP